MKDLQKKLKKSTCTEDVLGVIEDLIDFVEEICKRVVELESQLEKYEKIPTGNNDKKDKKGFFDFE